MRPDSSSVRVVTSAAPVLDQKQQCAGAVLVLLTEGADNREAAGEPAAGPGTDSQGAHLTKREKEVLELIAAGHSNKEIAGLLFISVRTVEFHRGRIIRKLDVENVADLIKRAITMGLTTLKTRS